MTCNITTNTTAAINCLSNRVEGFNIILLMVVLLAVYAFFIYLIKNIDWYLFPQIKGYITQAAYILTAWLLLPVLNLMMYLDRVLSFGLTGTFEGIYGAYFWLLLMVSTVWFFLFMFNIFAGYRRVLK